MGVDGNHKEFLLNRLESCLRPILIGITGGSGSGKSTLAYALLKTLGGRVLVIEQDAYYACCSHLTMAEMESRNFDHPSSVELTLLSDHLKELKAGNAVARPVYDFSTHSRLIETEPIKPTPVIIVEGLFLFVDPVLRDLFDLRIFLDLDADLRLLRRVRRDTVERGRTIESVLEQYLQSVRPMYEEFVAGASKYAHLTITPDNNSDNLVSIIKQLSLLVKDRGIKGNE